MCLRLVSLFLWVALLGAGQPPEPGAPSPHEEEQPRRLPNGRLQADEIRKADRAKSLEDAAELVRLATELQADLEKNNEHVLSLNAIKKADEIEKVTRRIKGRLRRF